MKDFSEVFSVLRREKGRSYQEVAEYLGIGERSVRYYESGERRPDFDGLLALARYFDVSLDYLVGRTDKREVNR